MREQVGRRLHWVLLAEDLPEDHNRVTLGPTADRAGLAGRRMSAIAPARTPSGCWPGMPSEPANRWPRRVPSRSASVRARANGHFMGTARMGNDPVDIRSAIAGDSPIAISNLGIIDGSVFPTASGMNPTTTICALALRAAEHLIEQRGVPAVRSRSAAASDPKPLPTPVQLSTREPRTGEEFTTRERRLLARVADVLIPAGEGMPSASEAGVATELLDALLAVRPDLAPALHTALASLPEGDLSPSAVRECGRATFATLTLVVAGAYYLSPRVRDLLGWHSERGRPLEMGAFPEYIAEGLLDHLVES